MARTPAYTQMTLKLLTERGYLAGVVEKWVPLRAGQTNKPGTSVAGFKKDLFGFIDIIAVSDELTIGVQSTSDKMKAPHLAKIKVIPEAWKWLSIPSRKIWLVTWKKAPLKPGGKALRWQPTVQVINQTDLDVPF